MASIVGRTGNCGFFAWCFCSIETDMDLVNLVVLPTYQIEMVFLTLKTDQFGKFGFGHVGFLRVQLKLEFFHFRNAVLKIFREDGIVESCRVCLVCFGIVFNHIHQITHSMLQPFLFVKLTISPFVERRPKLINFVD